MANLVLRTKCPKWAHVISEKINRVSSTLTKYFVCERYLEKMTGIVELDKELPFQNYKELVKSFCCKRDSLDASGESEAMVTAEFYE